MDVYSLDTLIPGYARYIGDEHVNQFAVIFTDGSCSGTDGGWGFTSTNHGERMCMAGSEYNTTSNRMELTAVIKALELLPPKMSVRIYSDSQYVVNGINSRVHRWLVVHGDTSDAIHKMKQAAIKNLDLWKQLFTLAGKRHISAIWVPGHSGIPLNEVANAGAQMCSKCCKL